MASLLQVIGSPSEQDIAFVTSEKARRYLRSLPYCPRADFRQLWPDADKQVGVDSWYALVCGSTYLKLIGHSHWTDI